MTKDYTLGFGVMLDPSFSAHVETCSRCESAGSNLAALCLEGSILYKRQFGVTDKKERPRRSENYCSKEDLAKMMRYK